VRYAEREIETNALSEQQPPVDFEAKFSGLKALLEKNHTAVERMASLQETHRSLEAQLYASENAVTVAQYEIADRDSREDLLKRRNLDLETSLKVFEDWELQRADETARNEELNHQIFLLQEALKEGDLKISNLEAELRNKDVEIQQKRQKIDEISEKLQNADVNVTSLREAVEADYEKKCEDMNRVWTNHRALEKAEEICDLRNKLSQESNSKKFAEKEVKDLKASLTKFRENDTQMVKYDLGFRILN
jgi:chromosome segregation ATPase